MKMEKFWTSSQPIHGLRHFVLVNKNKEKVPITFLMVSVLDSEIFLEITNDELLHSGNWREGWLNIPKFESITKEYIKYKSINELKDISKIFFKDDSLFNIS